MAVFQGKVTRSDWVFMGAATAGLVVIVAAFVFVVHAHQVGVIAELESQDDQVTRDLQEALVKKQKFGQLREECEKTQGLIDEFNKRLPPQRQIPMLLGQFEDLAKEINLEVELKPLPVQKDQRKETIPYSVRAFGDFHQIVSYINRLERYERFLKVSDLAIKEEKQGVPEASFKVSTFRFIETPPGQASQPSAAQPPAPASAPAAPASAPAATGGATS